jgi:hypothetical protein
MSNLFETMGIENLTETQKKAQELNEKAKGLKLKTALDINKDEADLKKDIKALEKELDKAKEESDKKEKAKIEKETKAKKEAQDLQADKDYLIKEGVDISTLDDKAIKEQATKLKASPKAPFDIYVQDTKIVLELESGKRYSMQDVKTLVTNVPQYQFLEKATANFNAKHNAVFFTLSGSTKGANIDYDKLMKVLKKVGLLEHQDDYLDEIKIMIKEEMEKK